MLVRMTQDGEPKYIRSDGVTEINWEDGPSSGCTGIAYEGGRPPVVVDGSPDEVFKALFNPPEMIDKEKVARVLDMVEGAVHEARLGRGPLLGLETFIQGARRDFGLRQMS